MGKAAALEIPFFNALMAINLILGVSQKWLFCCNRPSLPSGDAYWRCCC